MPWFSVVKRLLLSSASDEDHSNELSESTNQETIAKYIDSHKGTSITAGNAIDLTIPKVFVRFFTTSIRLVFFYKWRSYRSSSNIKTSSRNRNRHLVIFKGILKSFIPSQHLKAQRNLRRCSHLQTILPYHLKISTTHPLFHHQQTSPQIRSSH
jgi:hypothetical protein